MFLKYTLNKYTLNKYTLNIYIFELKEADIISNSMKLISIDVGIKNLAFCLFSEKVIDKWGVVDLSTQKTDPDKIYCSCMTTTKKQNKPCVSQAKWKKYDCIKNGYQYFCTKHAKSSIYIIPTSELKPLFLKKQTNQKLKEIIQKYGINTLSLDGGVQPLAVGVQPLAEMKKAELLSILNEYISQNVLEPILHETVNASSLDLVVIGNNLKTKFDELFQNTKIDRIIIENQISPIANRMKTIQGMIAQYFIMKYDNLTIDFINSSNKLKLSSIITTDYKDRKKLGIQLVLNYLNAQTQNDWLPFFQQHKKKDDLADCYLQGIWYIENKL